MKHLIQPRGPATGWVFRMVTPLELVGKLNPWTGKPFGKEIKKGLGKEVTKTNKFVRAMVATGTIKKGNTLNKQTHDEFTVLFDDMVFNISTDDVENHLNECRQRIRIKSLGALSQ